MLLFVISFTFYETFTKLEKKTRNERISLAATRKIFKWKCVNIKHSLASRRWKSARRPNIERFSLLFRKQTNEQASMQLRCTLHMVQCMASYAFRHRMLEIEKKMVNKTIIISNVFNYIEVVSDHICLINLIKTFTWKHKLCLWPGRGECEWKVSKMWKSTIL